MKTSVLQLLVKMRFEFLVGLMLLVTVLSVYWPISTYDFVNFDDNWYVYDNEHVKQGLSLKTLRWAFSIGQKEGTHWHPVTWISHLMDVRLFGLNPGKHHLTSLFIHTLSSLLLFVALRRMTRDIWPSAFVAAVFALHPVNVDSVVWIAERKNVLSTLWMMAALLAYTHYIDKRGFYRYLFVLMFFILGIMSKQMLVTFPFILLLIDYWPLARWQPSDGDIKRLWHLTVEKLPLFLLSFFLVLMTWLARPDIGQQTQAVAMQLRVENAVVSYAAYLGKIFWPRALAVLYPFPEEIPIWKTFAAGMLLISISFGVWHLKKVPAMLTGWLWYLGTLIPVSGIFQIGLWPAMADRWIYIPLIGICIAVSWGSTSLGSKLPSFKWILGTLSLSLIIVLTWLTSHQITHWQNSITLFEHAVRLHPNPIALTSLGSAYFKEKRYHEAIEHYQNAIRMSPGHGKAHNDLANALAAIGEDRQADFHLHAALKATPWDPVVNSNMGLALLRKNRPAESMRYFTKAIALDPDFSPAYRGLAIAMLQTGRVDGAIRLLLKVLQIDPQYTDAQEVLEKAEQAKMRRDQKIQEARQRLANSPHDMDLLLELGHLYSSYGMFRKALTQYRSALQINPKDAETLKAMGLTYAAIGEYEHAVAELQKALKINQLDADIPYYIAGVYARQNKNHEALKWLKRAVDQGYDQWDSMRQDSNLINIRNTDYYRYLMEEGNYAPE